MSIFTDVMSAVDGFVYSVADIKMEIAGVEIPVGAIGAATVAGALVIGTGGAAIPFVASYGVGTLVATGTVVGLGAGIGATALGVEPATITKFSVGAGLAVPAVASIPLGGPALVGSAFGAGSTASGLATLTATAAAGTVAAGGGFQMVTASPEAADAVGQAFDQDGYKAFVRGKDTIKGKQFEIMIGRAPVVADFIEAVTGIGPNDPGYNEQYRTLIDNNTGFVEYTRHVKHNYSQEDMALFYNRNQQTLTLARSMETLKTISTNYVASITPDMEDIPNSVDQNGQPLYDPSVGFANYMQQMVKIAEQAYGITNFPDALDRAFATGQWNDDALDYLRNSAESYNLDASQLENMSVDDAIMQFVLLPSGMDAEAAELWQGTLKLQSNMDFLKQAQNLLEGNNSPAGANLQQSIANIMSTFDYGTFLEGVTNPDANMADTMEKYNAMFQTVHNQYNIVRKDMDNAAAVQQQIDDKEHVKNTIFTTIEEGIWNAVGMLLSRFLGGDFASQVLGNFGLENPVADLQANLNELDHTDASPESASASTITVGLFENLPYAETQAVVRVFQSAGIIDESASADNFNLALSTWYQQNRGNTAQMLAMVEALNDPDVRTLIEDDGFADIYAELDSMLAAYREFSSLVEGGEITIEQGGVIVLADGEFDLTAFSLQQQQEIQAILESIRTSRTTNADSLTVDADSIQENLEDIAAIMQTSMGTVAGQSVDTSNTGRQSAAIPNTTGTP